MHKPAPPAKTPVPPEPMKERVPWHQLQQEQLQRDQTEYRLQEQRYRELQPPVSAELRSTWAPRWSEVDQLRPSIGSYCRQDGERPCRLINAPVRECMAAQCRALQHRAMRHTLPRNFGNSAEIRGEFTRILGEVLARPVQVELVDDDPQMIQCSWYEKPNEISRPSV